MKQYKLAVVLGLVLFSLLIFCVLIGSFAQTRINRLDVLEARIAPYLPGNSVPGCATVYYSYDYVSCTVSGIPGTSALHLTISEYNGQIYAMFAILTEPIRIGDLVERYGAYDLVYKNGAATWTWDDLVVYKYQRIGYPTKLTEVYMLSWRKV